MNIVTKNWRDLIRPRGVQVELEERDGKFHYGKFTCEPLERGYGITVGNSLRRVLLSSLQGAAITAIKIDGALHEFTSVADVVEDVSDIILNLKEVVLKAAQAKTYTVHINKEGPGPVYAKDIQLVDGLEVLNPDHLIATLDKKGPLVMELTVNVGRGYVPADKNKTANMSLGTIPIDALFSPVRKVNYTVTNARVGQVTDYDKLTLEVWTNGAVGPEDSVAYAAKILKEQLNLFINFEEMAEPTEPMRDEEQEKLNENLWRTVDELELQEKHTDATRFTLPMYLKIGFFQCLAMIPGVSRSGSTIVGSMLIGVDRKAAAEFSFFMAIPIMVGAFALDLLKSYKDIDTSHAGTIAIGFVVSFLSGLLVVKTMIAFIGKRGFAPFAWWRIVVGVIGLGLIYIPR